MPAHSSIASEYGGEAMRIATLLNIGCGGALAVLVGLRLAFLPALLCFGIGFWHAACGWLLIFRLQRRTMRAEMQNTAKPTRRLPLRSIRRLAALCLFLSLASYVFGCFLAVVALSA